MLLSHVSIRSRIVLMCLVFVIGVIVIHLFSASRNTHLRDSVIYPTFENSLMETMRSNLKAIVKIEIGVLAEELKNTKNREDIISKIESQTDPIRFLDDKSGYFFTYNLKGERINVPINKSLNGKDCLHLKDSNGFLFVEEFVKAAKNGGGFVTYYFEKEGKGIQPKLSYVELIPGTDILVGTGVYIDNISDNLGSLKNNIASAVRTADVYLWILVASVLLFFGIIALLIARSITSPLTQIVQFTSNVATGDFSKELTLHQKDELGILASGLCTMVSQLRNRIEFTEGVLKGITLPCFIGKNDDTFEYINQAAIDFYDLHGSPEDYKGTSISKFFYNDTGRKSLNMNVIETGQQILHHRIEFTTSHGRKKVTLIDLSPLSDQEGKTTASIAIFVDISEIVEQQERAEKSRAEGMLQAAHQLEEIVNVVTAASEQLSKHIGQSSEGALQQSQRVTQTATAMEEMNSIVVEVARNAGHAAETAESARVKAQEGAEAVSLVVKGIENVYHQSMSVKDDMATLGKQADGIGHILNVISDIADQTNLLALNAAIEAARAGDAGRGFAVVADEVRKLAEKTMTATKEVGEAIRGIQESTQRNIINVEKAASTIEEATGLANTSGETLKAIVSLVIGASDQVRSIAAASEEQSAASMEINNSIEQVAAISSETSQAMEQASRAVGDLVGQTNILLQLLGEMKAESGAASGPKALSA